jgi:hypothetical protein
MTPTIEHDFVNLLVQLAAAQKQGFSGLGLVLYDDLQSLANYHCNLVNAGPVVPAATLGTSEFSAYLLSIADYRHSYHDGFHFIDTQGRLTHVAQFFSPPIDKCLPNILGQGARTFGAQCGSQVPGVRMVGSVSSNSNIYLFARGKLVNEEFILLKKAPSQLRVVNNHKSSKNYFG